MILLLLFSKFLCSIKNHFVSFLITTLKIVTSIANKVADWNNAIKKIQATSIRWLQIGHWGWISDFKIHVGVFVPSRVFNIFSVFCWMHATCLAVKAFVSFVLLGVLLCIIIIHSSLRTVRVSLNHVSFKTQYLLTYTCLRELLPRSCHGQCNSHPDSLQADP